MQRRRRLRGAAVQAAAPARPPSRLGAIPGPERDPVETARYIGQMTAEMTRLATAAQLDILAYLLSMAQTEADAAARVLAEDVALCTPP